jgi:hypothetical protein
MLRCNVNFESGFPPKQESGKERKWESKKVGKKERRKVLEENASNTSD